MYNKYIKRVLDFSISLSAMIILLPLFIVLIIIGSLFMHGNPFFIQERPGRNEKIFKLIKFRTMNNIRDSNGELLPDMDRLNRYGTFLRKTSLDELPELLNILKGDMAFVGPRPLLIKYLPYYTERERIRHKVRPGLTGLAQVHGRNNLCWDKRLDMDVQYVERITLVDDVRIIILTIKKVLKHEDIVLTGKYKILDLDQERKNRDGNN